MLWRAAAFRAAYEGAAGGPFRNARDLLDLYANPATRAVDRKAVAAHLSRHIDFGEIGGQMLSPAEMLLSLLEVNPQAVDGPTAPGSTTYKSPTIPRAAFRRATSDAADFVRRAHRLPNEVFIGSETLSLADFAATLEAAWDGGDPIQSVRGNIEFERYFASDGREAIQLGDPSGRIRWLATDGPRPASRMDPETGQICQVVPGCPRDPKQCDRNDNRSDGSRDAPTGRGETFGGDGGRYDGHRAQVHDPDDQQDRRQAGAAAAAVEAEAQAMSPGGAGVGQQRTAGPGTSRQQAS